MAKIPMVKDSQEDGPAAKSIDYLAMEPLWHQVTTVLGGTNAIRESARTYLPKHTNELDLDYDERCRVSKFTNVYRDIVENLSQRPFAKEVKFDDDAGDFLEEFSEDVDGRGNSLHSFAGDVFFFGINYGIEWILVDYTANVPVNATRAQERQMGARPFWVSYRAEDVIFVESAVINGREQFTHVRLREAMRVRDGWKQVTKDCIRVFNREPIEDEEGKVTGYANPTYSVYVKERSKVGIEEWIEKIPPTPMTIDEIPLVPFMTGRRKGTSWQVHAPMEDACDLQIELFQQESALKHIKTMAAFPMLAANGVSPPVGENGSPETIRVSPQTVLFAPPEGVSGNGGEWKFIEPSSETLRFLADDIKDTIKELRELGRQPLTAQSGNLTVVTTAFAAQKGNSAIQAWALNLKIALENCVWYTGKWVKQDLEADVNIDTDFDIGFGDDASFEFVLKLREKGDISRDAELVEAKRRGILNADYDPEEDLELIDRDMVGDGDDPDSIGAGSGSDSADDSEELNGSQGGGASEEAEE